MTKTGIFKVITLLTIINLVLFNGIAADKNTHFEVLPAQVSNIKNVIFDLGDVLFAIPKSAKRTIFLKLFYENPTFIPRLAYKACTADIKKELFTMLNRVAAHSKEPMYNQGDQIPQIMVDWMNGRSSRDVLHTIEQHLQKYPYSETDKMCFRKIIRFMFEAEQLAGAMEPIKPMIQLAQAFKAKGYKLYVLSNWDSESFALMRQKHSDVFNLFDGIVVSGQEKQGKPHKSFYETLLIRYNLNPKECVFIDDEEHNTHAAEINGITAVWKQSLDSVLIRLQELKLVTKSITSSETAVHMARMQELRTQKPKSNT